MEIISTMLLRILRAATLSDWTAFSFTESNLLYTKESSGNQQPSHIGSQSPPSAGRGVLAPAVTHKSTLKK